MMQGTQQQLADDFVECEGCGDKLPHGQAVCTQDEVYLCPICADCCDLKNYIQNN